MQKRHDAKETGETVSRTAIPREYSDLEEGPRPNPSSLAAWRLGVRPPSSTAFWPESALMA